jgi:hypothetical protein
VIFLELELTFAVVVVQLSVKTFLPVPEAEFAVAAVVAADLGLGC